MKKRAFQEILRESFEKHKDCVALEKGQRDLTYSRLDSQSEAVYNWIRANGINRGDFVGVSAAGGIDAVVVLLGIIKAGCVFVPLESGLPKNKSETLLGLTKPAAVFCEERERHVFSALAERDTFRIVTLTDVPGVTLPE
ncbi:MAG: AMP-binding protein, partial [bacterium]|nr:AMP-binding protein [bacterium]